MSNTIPAGPLKLLLINEEAMARNVQRSAGVTQEVARIAVMSDDGKEVERVIKTNSVRVNGAVSFLYSQHAPLALVDREFVRAAFATTDEVVVDEVAQPERAEQSPTAAKSTPKPSKPAKAPTVKTEETTTNGE
jgi:hypothetical protein